MTGYSAKAIANYFLAKYGNNGIIPLKIQKLVYIAHGWYLAFHDEPLVNDEFAEAWEYGPVFASLYHELKYRGNLPVLDLATEFDHSLKKIKPKVNPKDDQTTRLLDKVWEIYGYRSGQELSKLCHQPNSPWEKARTENPMIRNAHIDNRLIQEHFLNKLRHNSAKND
ncbi:MAG: DUF4065 domain-containing protein [Rhodobacteraceae bacterium]|nr:DUF4065 domain-containing protein [Paracoccaceae bacterium]